MNRGLVYLLGVLTPFVAWVVIIMFVVVVDIIDRALNHPIYRTRWYSTRHYRFIERSDEGNAIAITLPWWKRAGLVIRFWPRPLR